MPIGQQGQTPHATEQNDARVPATPVSISRLLLAFCPLSRHHVMSVVRPLPWSPPRLERGLLSLVSGQCKRIGPAGDC